MPKISTTINGGAVNTILPREGVDIGTTPDFWGDLGQIKTRLKPLARDQEKALRSYREAAPTRAPMPSSLRAPRVPLFGVYKSVGNGLGWWEPWTPGAGGTPVAMGYLPEGYAPPKIPENAYMRE